MADPMPSFARTVLVELILTEMNKDPRNRPYLMALRPILRVAVRQNSWAATAHANGMPLDILTRAATALRYILVQSGAELGRATPPLLAAPPEAGIPASHARGGRPPKLSPSQRSEAARLRAEGMPVATIARKLGVSRSTISRLEAPRPPNPGETHVAIGLQDTGRCARDHRRA